MASKYYKIPFLTNPERKAFSILAFAPFLFRDKYSIETYRKSSMPSYFRVFWKEASHVIPSQFKVAEAWVLSG